MLVDGDREIWNFTYDLRIRQDSWLLIMEKDLKLNGQISN